MLKSIVILGSVALPMFPAFAEEPVPRENLHIYLLIGQSNMAGRAKMEEADAKAIERCLLLKADDEWEPATSPLNRHSTIRKGLGMQKLGPGAGFAEAMTERNPDVTIGLVVNAKGGTKIGQWKKGTKFYQEAVRRAKVARESGTLKGILWHQGESDEGSPDGYLDQLAQLVKDLRKDLGEKDLPFVAGQVNKVPAINEQIAKLPETVGHTAFVSSEGLNATDRWHFDRDSVLLLGERYAEAMLTLQSHD